MSVQWKPVGKFITPAFYGTAFWILKSEISSTKKWATFSGGSFKYRLTSCMSTTRDFEAS